MADEEISSATEGGAGVTTEQQEAEGTSQEGVQSQSPESTQVEGGESQASSKGQQARKNYDWAAQRTLEKTVKRVLSSALDERFAQLEQRLSPQEKPPASQPSNGEIDFNDLPGSIQKMVNALVQQQMKDGLGKTIPQLKQEIIGDFQTKTTRQEARNYLISQKDIGNDTSKHDEIQDIIANDKLLYHSVGEYPKEVMQEAIERWRKGRTNPNAPSKGELGTITGGMGGVQRKTGEVSVQRLRELQDKVVSSNLPATEREKLNLEIDELMASFK